MQRRRGLKVLNWVKRKQEKEAKPIFLFTIVLSDNSVESYEALHCSSYNDGRLRIQGMPGNQRSLVFASGAWRRICCQITEKTAIEGPYNEAILE